MPNRKITEDHFLAQREQKTGKGQNVENQNVKSQKEHRKFEKDQNVKSLFLFSLN